MKETFDGAALEELQPLERSHIGDVPGGLPPEEGNLGRSRGRVCGVPDGHDVSEGTEPTGSCVSCL